MMALMSWSLYMLREAALAPGAETEIAEQWREFALQFGPIPPDALAEQMDRYRGSYADLLAYRLGDGIGNPIFGNMLSSIETLGLMLLGMAGLKSGFLTGQWDRQRYARYARIGYLIGVPLLSLLAIAIMASGFDALTLFFLDFSGQNPVHPAVFLAHAALILYWVTSDAGSALMNRIAAVGRAAFTNYLGTSIICTTIFLRLWLRPIWRVEPRRPLSGRPGGLGDHATLVQALARPFPIRTARVAVAQPRPSKVATPSSIDRARVGLTSLFAVLSTQYSRGRHDRSDTATSSFDGRFARLCRDGHPVDQHRGLFHARHGCPQSGGLRRNGDRKSLHLGGFFVLVDGKMRGLFTLLFGASMMLVLERAEANDQSPAGVHYSRMVWLALFGLAHFFFIWWGDILFLYAGAGCVMFFMRNWEARTLINGASSPMRSAPCC